MAALALSLAIRWLHVLGMALLLGGAVLAWWALRIDTDEQHSLDPVGTRVAWGYEWLFWAAVGVLVMTGVGNLGAMAPAIPVHGGWAHALTAKLGGLLVLLPLSVVRTIALHRMREFPSTGDSERDDRRGLRALYGLTVLLLLVVLVLAEVLAHG